MTRRTERGYALVLVAIAIVFLALVSSVVVRAAVGGATSSKLESDQGLASSIASAGVEWALATDLAAGTTATHTFGGGTFEVTRSGRKITSTGTYDKAKRVAAAERSVAYVPDSRWSDNDSTVTFEIYNLTGEDLGIRGLTARFTGATAFFESVKLSVFANTASGAAPVDYGTVWQSTSSRAGSGTQITFAVGTDGNVARTLGNQRQALIELVGFKAAASGVSSAVDMDQVQLNVSFHDAGGTLPSTPVPEGNP